MKLTTILLKSALLLLTLFTTDLLRAQTEKISPNFRQEIGLDLSMPLHEYWGTSIVYKYHIGQPRFKKWQKRQAIRGLAGFYKHQNAALAEYARGDSAVILNIDGQERGAFIHGGWELQFTRKKLRFYFGGDVGFEYIHADYQNRYEIKENGISLTPYNTKTVSTRTIPKASAFGGINYFLTRRLSLGIEINMPFAIDIESSRTTGQHTDSKYDNTVMEFGGDYFPRMIYISWHFGESPKESLK
mgnify:CR=1 FL=1